MPTNAEWTSVGEPGTRLGAEHGSRAAEARRREIVLLLDEIRCDRPTPGQIVEAIRRASNGELPPDRVQRIAGSVLALYR